MITFINGNTNRIGVASIPAVLRQVIHQSKENVQRIRMRCHSHIKVTNAGCHGNLNEKSRVFKGRILGMKHEEYGNNRFTI